jgi:hypothetical protein
MTTQTIQTEAPVDRVAETISFVRSVLDVDLLPWQEDFLRAAITGEHVFEHRIRHVDTGQFRKPVYGLFSTAQKVVDRSLDPSEWEIYSRPAFPFRSLK